MRSTELFTKTKKQAPADEVSKNAQLLIRAGYIHKEMAGVYTFLPMGLRVLENICQVIREEMNAIGGQELKMTTLQDPEIWQATDRWDDEKVDVWFKTKLKNGSEIGLGPTHEEPLIRAVKPYISSYKDLPFLAYQIQTKFRNETRAKSGVMRGREFLMKDLYSFARTEQEHDELYEKIKQAYFKVYKRLGVGEQTFLTFASGGMFSQFSHEFQTVCEAGEDTIYLDRKKGIAINEEVNDDKVLAGLGVKREDLEEVRAAEVGNIFTLKDKFSKPLGLNYLDENNQEMDVLMGCYGIGPSRLVGVITELLGDDKGLVWPYEIAPFKVYIVRIGDSEAVIKATDKLYAELNEAHIEAFYDDRDVRPGEKFADADLIGIPIRLVVSEKTLAGEEVEFKKRTDSNIEMVKLVDIIERIKSN
ncbi:MAG: His/Gly/Thr/Pro-type tRNA ligase C-terminal domain-containing protein [Candidatus Saccharibacteria bacterium]|nr:His/Gly/Thr/Pro-type tRNA ligase C-terminal domain-containing protein [Candidatus Saccharibacteria bacterium]